jgi:hypothetical protein
MYKYFDIYTSTLVAQSILTPATKLKHKTNNIILHYDDNYDMIRVADPIPETSQILNIYVIKQNRTT